jgi:hypothetical protein
MHVNNGQSLLLLWRVKVNSLGLQLGFLQSVQYAVPPCTVDTETYVYRNNFVKMREVVKIL